MKLSSEGRGLRSALVVVFIVALFLSWPWGSPCWAAESIGTW